MKQRQAERQRAVGAHKRRLILDAAQKVFAREGLEGSSLRLIAAEAGYTPAALYFHFQSKEAIYAELLQESLGRLGEAVAEGAPAQIEPADRLRRAGMAFFGYYARHPGELDLGFYLFRGGMKPAGLGREWDEALNAALIAALAPVTAAAEALGASREAAQRVTVNCFAHAAGLLLLMHTGRIRIFGAQAESLMADYLEGVVAEISTQNKG